MNEQVGRPTRPARSAGTVILEFLGSMNLAITLLVAIAIAAVIGTVLQQNQPYPDYVIKFGPFWFEIFRSLGLYNVYGTVWFLILVGFLLVSTSVCIYRNVPHMLGDVRRFRLDVQEKSLRNFHHRSEWRVSATPEAVGPWVQGLLKKRGFRIREKVEADHRLFAAMKGGWNRGGYFFTHLAIVVICVGSLVGGNLPLKVAEWMGRIDVETRDIPASQVPQKSTLPSDNFAFRGNVRIPEGTSADFVFLNVRDGFLLQQLPFRIELKDFRIEHYPSGQPKSFESDIVIHDPALQEPMERTIAVNHPLIYKGHAIYQASFSDGGSRLKMKAWPLDTPDADPLSLEGAIYQNLRLTTSRGPMTLELIDFKLYNIFPIEEGIQKFRNYGPSLVFKLRNAGGEAVEYMNYLAPVDMQGKLYFMSGVRNSPAEPYRYLYLPADSKASLDRFLRLRELALDEERVRRVVMSQTEGKLPADTGTVQQGDLAEAVVRLTEVFVRGGMEALMNQVQQAVPEAERDAAMESYLLVLQNVLGGLYIDVLKEEGVDVSKGVSDNDAAFFDDALQSISALGSYGSPFFLQLTDFQHVEASGLQIAKAPEQDIVYLGFVMLMVGVFLMFYVHHRRVWVRIADDAQGGSRILLAGSGSRDRADFGTEFSELQLELERLTEKLPEAGAEKPTER